MVPPQQAGAPCLPHQAGETFVSPSDMRERVLHPSKAFLDLLQSMEGASPGLPRGKLRHRGAKQHGLGKLRYSPSLFVPLCTCPHPPCALGNSPGTRSRGILPNGPLRACCWWPRVKVLGWAWGSGRGGSKEWRPYPTRGLPRGHALESGRVRDGQGPCPFLEQRGGVWVRISQLQFPTCGLGPGNWPLLQACFPSCGTGILLWVVVKTR